jgi:xylose isomerase
MKTSLGIWAFGPMVTRFVPGGYQPDKRQEPMPEKVHRAVSGLGDLMDDYEFHYPGELNRDNLEAVRAALDGHGIYAIAGGLHVDERFQKGGLTNLDDAVRSEALGILLEAADLAGEIGAQMIVWPGGEGYNYPFQVPYAESWSRLIDGIGQVAERLAQHGRLLFLEHKNSEPAMKIHMSNIGMTLHVVHTLRARGITNVQVNMDWQHLIMNGEHLAEYAALLAAEGLSATSMRMTAGARSTTTTWWGRSASWRRSSSRSSCAARTTARTASGSASTSIRTRRTRSRP